MFCGRGAGADEEEEEGSPEEGRQGGAGQEPSQGAGKQQAQLTQASKDNRARLYCSNSNRNSGSSGSRGSSGSSGSSGGCRQCWLTHALCRSGSIIIICDTHTTRRHTRHDTSNALVRAQPREDHGSP